MKITIEVPFSGLYESIWLNSDDSREREENEYRRSEELPELDFNSMSFRFKDYLSDIGDYLSSEWVQEVNSRFGLNLIPGIYSVWSPQSYNYHTDKIGIEVDIDNEDINKICQMLKDRYCEISAVVMKNHTSCSGFVSFLSNNLYRWIESIQEQGDDWVSYLSLSLHYLHGDIEEWEYDMYYDFDFNFIDYYESNY